MAGPARSASGCSWFRFRLRAASPTLGALARAPLRRQPETEVLPACPAPARPHHFPSRLPAHAAQDYSSHGAPRRRARGRAARAPRPDLPRSAPVRPWAELPCAGVRGAPAGEPRGEGERMRGEKGGGGRNRVLGGGESMGVGNGRAEGGLY